MAFTMLSGQTVYREKVAQGEGYWLDGVYYQGEDVVNYEPLSGVFVEPFDREEAELLPTGIKTSDARWLLCDHVLDTYKKNNDDASYADKVYLRETTTGTKANCYVVMDLEEWDTYGDFTMIEGGYNYIIIKESAIR